MTEQTDRNSVKSDALPQEMPAVRTTIVGGRPPGSGKAIGAIPRGIEVLVKKAAVDPQFKDMLLAKRSAAAESIGLALNPAEVMMLDIVPAVHLESIISQTRVEPTVRPAFLGKAAAVMLVALGAGGYVTNGETTDGVRMARPASTAPADVNAPPVSMPKAGMRIAVPATTQPAATSQPTSAPASLWTEEKAAVEKLVVQLDSDEYTVREAAQKKLMDMGLTIIPMLQEKLKDPAQSAEACRRMELIIGRLQASTQPVKPPPDVQISNGIRAMPIQPEQN